MKLEQSNNEMTWESKNVIKFLMNTHFIVPRVVQKP